MSDHSQSNSVKSKDGWDNKASVGSICQKLKNEGLIKNLQEKVYFKAKNRTYEKQFKADFILTDLNDDYILVYTSTSFRDDRIRGVFWDAQGVTKALKASKVAAALFVTSDQWAHKMHELSERTRNQIWYSPITHWLTQTEFIAFIHQWALEQDVRNEQGATMGAYYGKRGNNFETDLCMLFNSRSPSCDELSIEERVDDNDIKNQIVTLMLDTILISHKVSKDNVLSISAHKQIRLPSKGLGKTDISLLIQLKEGESIQIGISCKATNSSEVSCHEYSWEDFVEVFNKNNVSKNDLSVLEDGLKLFQKSGNWQELNKKEESWKTSFFEALDRNMGIIFDWAISGKTYPNEVGEFVADYLLLFNPKSNQFRFIKSEDYKNELLGESAKVKKRKQGYPFSWTYPSKKRGSSIQLKVPVRFDGV